MNRPASERGEQTRAALIEAAMPVFGQAGFEAASTRAIADRAGVNLALIAYHFGGKQGLYLAVFEHILGQLQARLAPVAAPISEQLGTLSQNSEQRHRQALALLASLFDAMIDTFGEAEATHWVRLIFREHQDPTEAFELLYSQLMGSTLSLISELVAVLTGLDQDTEACRIRTLMLMGQVLVFHVARAAAFRHLQWSELSLTQRSALKTEYRIMLQNQFALTGESS